MKHPNEMTSEERINWAADLIARRSNGVKPELPITGKVKGVGTVLSSIFSTIGITTSEGCSCRRHAVEMDRRGTTWCLENIETILGWLQTEATVRNLVFFRAGIKIALYSLLKAYSVFEKVRPDSGEDSRVFSRRDDEWAVVVTAAPRAGEYTLAKCLQSIIAAGWSDPIVFAEPGIDVPDGITTFHNPTRRGCFHNWLYSAKWALENTTAEMILCVQDDSLFHPDSRQFTEDHCLWPSEDTGIVSLYTASHYQGDKGVMKPVGVNEVYTSVWWGTCAVVWRRSALQAVIDHEITKNWLGISPRKQADESHNPKLRARRVAEYFEGRKTQPHLINNSDYVAGHVLNLLGCRKFFVDPSPVSHISKVSTINHGGNSGKRNCARCADHRKPLASQVGTAINRISNDNPNRMKYPTIIRPCGESMETPILKFLIRSSYSDPNLSQHRWEITKHTLLPALMAQTDKRFDIELICSEADTLRDEKLKSFQDAARTTIASNDWYNLPHDKAWRRIARVDDDDLIACNFVELINTVPCDGVECLLSFPSGYMLTEQITRRWDYPPNMFCTVQTNTRFTPYHMSHRHMRQIMPTVVVSDQPSWAWVRHTTALSFAERKAKRKRGECDAAFDLNRFPYDIPAIQNLCKPPEQSLQMNRKKNHDKDVCSKMDVSSPLTELADRYSTHKGISYSSRSHQYSIIYEQMFAEKKAEVTHVLEIGIGPSLYMWAEYFQNAVVHGLDRSRSNISGARIVTHVGNAVDSFEFGVQFDLIVDDASHVSSQQRKAFQSHGRHVKPGGYYVIESLHAIRMQEMIPHKKWIDESPNMLESCREWGHNPPDGWECSLYGDQLCVLRKKNT